MRRAIPSPRPPSDEVLDEVQVAFQRVSPRPFSREDAREAVHNLARFFDVLERWAREDEEHGPLSGQLGNAVSSNP